MLAREARDGEGYQGAELDGLVGSDALEGGDLVVDPEGAQLGLQ